MTDAYENERERWRATMVAKGHTPRLDDDGKLDLFACDYEHHNGPACSGCHWSTCMICDDVSDIPDCDNPVLELTATPIAGLLK